jgi:Glycosyl transferase family 2
MASIEDKMDRAWKVLQQGNAERAAKIASNVLEMQPDTAEAYLLRAQTCLHDDNSLAALSDCLEGLALPSIAPSLAQRFEAFIFDELLEDLNKNFFKIDLLMSADGSLDNAPRVASLARLLGLLRHHDVAGALAFGTNLSAEETSARSKRLMSRVFLSYDRLPDAIEALSEALVLEERSLLSDSNLVAMEHYRRNQELGLRDPSIFRPRYKLVVCAALKDEADDLAEWLAYHANLGVEAFYLYDNDSTDSTPHIIAALSSRYNITCYPISHQPAQTLAYRHFFEAHRFDAEWVAMIDGDEFINPRGGSLSAYLDRSPDCAAIAINWMVFGSSGFLTKPNGLCIESFVKRAPDDHIANAHIKGIVRPQRLIRHQGPHQQLMLGRYEDASGNIVFPMSSMVHPPRHDPIGLHHYAVKSQEQAERKLARGRPLADHRSDKFRSRSYVTWYDCNDIEDRSAARFAESVRNALASFGHPGPRESDSGK